MNFTQQFTSQLVFAIRRVSGTYRLPLLAVVGATMMFALVVTNYVGNLTALRAAQEEQASLSKLGSATPSPNPTISAKPNLKTFHSSHLLSILEEGASVADLKLDEISFSIDSSPQQPYVRYRASFQVLSRYPTIRKFISLILAGSEGVVLDTVACRREDTHATNVRCDISAYIAYREGVSG